MDIIAYLLLDVFIHIGILIIIFKEKFLTWPDGILIAGLISFLIFLAGYMFWITLFAFFIPSSIISKINQEKKKNEIIVEKADQRNALQVLSNSLGLFICALIQLLINGIDGKINFLLLISGSLFVISASADTWSTEIGTLNKSDPYYILNLRKKVPKGTSGGVSLIGTLGALLGATIVSVILFIMIIYERLVPNFFNEFALFIFLVILGFSGSIIDSILGATLQNKYYCPVCMKNVEEKYHAKCKTNNLTKINSKTFLNNNTVNIFSNILVSLLGFLLIIIYFNPF